MKRITYLLTIAFLALNFTSCDEDNSSTSNKDLLSDKLWMSKSKIINPAVSVNGFVVSDITVLEPEEVRKYSFKFNEDGTFILYNHLNTSIFQTTWSINSDETKISFTDPIIYTYPIVGEIGLTTMTIQSLTSSELVTTIPAIYEGVNYEITITFI